MSTPPTTPQWAVNVTVADGKYTVRQSHDGKLEALRYGQPWRDLTGDGLVLALAQAVESAPPLSPPTDEAKLREVIRSELEMYDGILSQKHIEDLSRNIVISLAPHLAKGEPGDSELLDWLDKTEHDLVFECGDPDVGAFSAWQVWRNAKWQDGRPLMVAFDGSLRAAIKAAMRGEGKP